MSKISKKLMTSFMNGPKGIFSEIPYWPFVALQKLLKIKIPANF